MKLPTEKEALAFLNALKAQDPSWDITAKEFVTAAKVALSVQRVTFKARSAGMQDTLAMMRMILEVRNTQMHPGPLADMDHPDSLPRFSTAAGGDFGVFASGDDRRIAFTQNDPNCTDPNCLVHHPGNLSLREHARAIVAHLEQLAPGVPVVAELRRMVDDERCSIEADANGILLRARKVPTDLN